MKLIWIILSCLSFIAHSSVPNGCPSTRSCSQDVQCNLYAMKHNCHSTCMNKEIQTLAGEKVQCPSQCLCVPGTQKKLFG
jgi:hypothetical protein